MNTLNFNNLLVTAISEPGIISDAYRAFHRFSIGNQLAAAWQCRARAIPLAPIASFKAWQEKGRQVRKGEKAIALCMPVTCKTEKEKADGTKEEVTFSRFTWRNNWFVLSQTDGDDYIAEITTPEWGKAVAMAALKIEERAFEHVDGNVQGFAIGRSIAVNPLAKYPQKTRFHELAHVVLGHTESDACTDDSTLNRAIKEVEAESVAFILCSILDLPGQAESRGYIQSWLSGAAITEKSAQKIFSCAEKILKAGKE